MTDLVKKLGFRYIAGGRKVPMAKNIESFLTKSLVVQLFQQLDVDCVLDVGANRGQYALGLRAIGYRGDIHSFEPIADDFRKLAMAAANDDKWHVHNFALGQENGLKEFNVVGSGSSNTVFSSFLTPDHDMIPNEVVKCQVEVRTLDSLVTELPELTAPDRRVFLKLDAQGFDIEVCKGAEKVLQHIVGLQSELSVKQIYSGQVNYLSALKYYHDLGFSLMDLSIVNRTADNAVLEYDCLMARLG